MKKFSKDLIIIAFSAALLSCQNGQSDAVKIGVIADRTGFMSGHGTSIEMGSTLAADYLNSRGGINGKPVEILIRDGKSDPTESAQMALNLINRENVDLIVGTGTSAASLAVISSIESASTPFIYSLDGEAKTCDFDDQSAPSGYVFGSGFTERMVVRPLLTHLATQVVKIPDGGAMRIYFTGGDYVYPRTTNQYARDVARDLGHEIVGEEYTPTDLTDYAPTIRKIIDASPDLLIVTNPGASGVTFMRQARQFRLADRMIISGFATFDQEAIDAMGAASEGVYCINRYSKNLENPENRVFLDAFSSSFPTENLLPGPTAAAGAYGSILLAGAAMSRAESEDLSGFTEAMSGLEMRLPQGLVRVNPENFIVDQPIYLRVTVKSGVWPA